MLQIYAESFDLGTWAALERAERAPGELTS